MAQELHLKRKLEDLSDLTGNGNLNNSKREKQSQATPGVKKNGSDKTVDDEKPFARFEDFHASDDHESRKEEKFVKAQSAQTNLDVEEEQPLFECGTCRKTFKNIAELNDHDIKHKQQLLIRCKKCRKTFTDIAERDHHFRTSSLHFCCRYCENVAEFRNADSLRYHYVDRHHELYCHLCDLQFPNAFQRLRHMSRGHWPCFACRKMIPTHEICNSHCRNCYSARFGKAIPEPPNREDQGKGLPDHYARLGISAHSPHEQVLKAAKEMRIKTHPDRLKRQEGLTDEQKRAIDAEAALVGQAADVLSDPDLRLKYDCNFHGW